MIYTLDTEFIENGTTIALLSLGLVAEDGREFYRQVVETDVSQANAWVRTHVVPQMTVCPSGQSKDEHWDEMSRPRPRQCVPDCPWQWKANIAMEIQAFVGAQPVFWGYYCDYDWVALCQLFGTMMQLPQGWPRYCRDLRQELDRQGLQHITQPEDMPHHALSDARWIMDTYRTYVQSRTRPHTGR